MPGWLKVLLIIAAIVVLLVVGVIVAGVIYVSRNKDAWLAKAKAVAEEGQKFGESTDNEGCVDETMSRYKADPGITSGIAMGVFMRACLEKSRPTPGFCEKVPGPTEFMKTGQWEADQCRTNGLAGDSYCPQIFAQVQQYCIRKSTRPNANNN